MGVSSSKLSKFIAANKYKSIRLGTPTPLTPKGYIPIAVGINNESLKRFIVHTKVLVDADFRDFLCRSEEEYGFHSDGIIRIPYEAKYFEEWLTKGPKQNFLRVKGIGDWFS